MALRNKQNKPTTLTNSSTPTEQAIIAMIKDEGSKSNVRSQTVKSYSNKKVLIKLKIYGIYIWDIRYFWLYRTEGQDVGDRSD